jgi:putative transposase
VGTYELFQQTPNLDDHIWWKMLRGLTTRNYPLVTRSFADAYGIEKSAISERFIQARKGKLKELMERPLGELKLCAIVIDGTSFKGRQMIAAVGVGNDGQKTVLGLREGATENAAVVRGLLEDLARRGLDFITPRLYVLDGAKALSAAVKRHAGDGALVQRCQVHIAGRDPRLPEGWKVPSRASPCEPGSLGSGMAGNLPCRSRSDT